MRTLLLLLATAAFLFADGGIVLLHQDAQQFVVTVFASPNPPRAGMVDISILVQTADALDPVLDTDVRLTLTNGTSQIHARATHQQAQNKMLYAASLPLDQAGDWSYTVTIHGISVNGVIAVAPQMPKPAAYAGYLALPFVCLAIFALHQWLLSRRHNCLRHNRT
jgi:hypothetical protein